jgi:hypothetical protein
MAIHPRADAIAQAAIAHVRKAVSDGVPLNLDGSSVRGLIISEAISVAANKAFDGTSLNIMTGLTPEDREHIHAAVEAALAKETA